jgi:hypothetical protein
VIRIVAYSHYFNAIAADTTALPALDERVLAVTRERYRRIDRFVQLSLLGACTCASGRSLVSDCALYLGSGTGPLGSNVQVQDAIEKHGRHPMPFAFMNTLGSSACFHVARELGMSGEAVLISRGRGSFSAALQCAMADLEAGVSSQLLVGAVEECVLPMSYHHALLRHPPYVTGAEGSHWVLLEQREDRLCTVVEAAQLEDATFDEYESGDAARLCAFLSRHPDTSFGFQSTAPGHAALVALH